MTIPTQSTTMANLGRHLGKKVAIGDKIGRLVGLFNEIAFVQINCQHDHSPKITRHKLEAVSPLLRSLSDLSEEEANECFRVAFGKASGPMYRLVVDREGTVENGQVCISAISEGLRLAIAFDCVSAWFVPKGSSVMHAMTFNAVALVRYLDSISIHLEDNFLQELESQKKNTDNQGYWLAQLSEITTYSLDDLQNAFALINEKEKFRTYVQIASLTGEKTMYAYINRLIKNRI